MMARIFWIVFLLTISCTSPQRELWLSGFEKPETNPILLADSSFVFDCPVLGHEVKWQKADVFNPAAIVKNDTIFLLFRAEDNPGAILGRRTSRIGIATSVDGVHFQKYPKPVLFPDSSSSLQWDWPGGCEDPRIVRAEDGHYVMLYTSWNYDVARLSAATSPDLIHWEKAGPVFEQAFEGRFLNTWTKSGSVVTELVNGVFQSTRINGKYWMYFGEDQVYLAYSDNLTDWTPVVDQNGELRAIMSPRDNKFDSRLTEPGPPALLTQDGILLMYNGKNSEGENTDPSLAKGTYCGGQALFDRDDPSKFLKRMDKPFICPDLSHEISGQYASGTTFIEGLVFYQGKWFLYYGTADSMVGVAVRQGPFARF